MRHRRHLCLRHRREHKCRRCRPCSEVHCSREAVPSAASSAAQAPPKPAPDRLAACRHLSLQYFTSAQSFSHFLRQVMMRPVRRNTSATALQINTDTGYDATGTCTALHAIFSQGHFPSVEDNSLAFRDWSALVSQRATSLNHVPYMHRARNRAPA